MLGTTNLLLLLLYFSLDVHSSPLGQKGETRKNFKGEKE